MSVLILSLSFTLVSLSASEYADHPFMFAPFFIRCFVTEGSVIEATKKLVSLFIFLNKSFLLTPCVLIPSIGLGSSIEHIKGLIPFSNNFG